MNAFYYLPQHIGATEFAPGYFKLDTEIFACTDDPSQADCFVLPTDIRHVTDAQILALPYLRGNEARHVFFSLSEFPTRALTVDALAFRTDHNKRLRAAGNARARVWAWGVEDLGAYAYLPASGFQFDIHAQLWTSSPLTDMAVEACKASGLKVHDRRHPFFYGTLETNKDPRLGELRQSFLETMQISRLVLVPRSRACVNRYRFYEAMSMGRVPVLLCDDCLLACDDKIDYDQCCVRVPERDAHLVGVYLQEWLATHSDISVEEMGEYGRAMWERWLAPARWETTWAELVKEMLDGGRRMQEGE